MGHLVDGEWHDTWYDTSKTGGKFERSTAAFRNYSQLNKYWRDEFEIVLPYDVTYR